MKYEVEIINKVKELLKFPEERMWFELKENWHNPNQLCEYISALANSATYIDENYGYFIWGISNNTHEIVGTNYNYHFKKIKIYCQKNKVLKKRKEILKKTEMNVIFKGFYLI